MKFLFIIFILNLSNTQDFSQNIQPSLASENGAGQFFTPDSSIVDYQGIKNFEKISNLQKPYENRQIQKIGVVETYKNIRLQNEPPKPQQRQLFQIYDMKGIVYKAQKNQNDSIKFSGVTKIKIKDRKLNHQKKSAKQQKQGSVLKV